MAKAKREATPGVAARTREKHLDRLRLFFGIWLKRKTIPFNPCDGFPVTSKAEDEAQTRKPFSPAELRTIFAPDRLVNAQPHKYWTPMLALYMGARVNEISQLHVEDVEEIAGIWGLHIRRKTKNRASRRFAPLHPELVRLGFLDYLSDVRKAGFDHVFAGLTWGFAVIADEIRRLAHATQDITKHVAQLQESIARSADGEESRGVDA